MSRGWSLFGSSKDDQKTQEEFNSQVRSNFEMLDSQARSLEAAVTSQGLTVQKILQDSRMNKGVTFSYPPYQTQYGCNQEQNANATEGGHGYPGKEHRDPNAGGTNVDTPATAHSVGGTCIETILEQLLEQTQETLRAQISSLNSAVEIHRGLLQKIFPNLSPKVKRTEIRSSHDRRASSASSSHTSHSRENLHFEDQISKLKKQYEDLQRSKEKCERNYQETLLGMERREKELNIKVERFELSQKRLETQNKELSRSETRLKDDKFKLEEEKKKLKKKVADLEAAAGQGGAQYQYSFWNTRRYPQQTRKSVTIQIFCPRKTDLMTAAEMEMTSMIRTQFDMEQIDLVDQKVENIGAIDRDKPVIVICMNASRLGTDVENALSGLFLNRKLAVVILHHKESHALPSQSSDRVLTSPEYKQLGAIVDMAFLSTKGVYSCDMNNKALDQLKAFINSHSLD